MKNKTLLILVFALSVSYVNGQKATRENVLLEIGTGTWCYYCPGAAMGADDLIANGHDVAVIENHNGDAFANTYSNARNSYYSISSLPTAKFDGILTVSGGSHTQSMYGSYLPKVNQRLATSSNFTMSMSGFTADYLNCEVDVDVNKVAGSYGNLSLYVAITESDIAYNWQGQNELNFVNRLMSPNQNGTTLNFSSQSSHQVTLNFTLNGSWDYEHCEVVAFLQNNSTKEVYQTIKLSMNDFSFDFLMAGFNVDNQEVFAGQGASFTDASSGDPTSWFWEFEGGIPATFSGQNPPPIYYNTIGTYDVSLSVSDGTDNDIEIKTDYITVIGITADFTVDDQNVVSGQAATFTDNSDGNPTSWLWEFEGGSPATFSGQNPPPIYYDAIGVYGVSLSISDGYSNDIETKAGYISVIGHCLATGGANYLYISNVAIGDIDNPSTQTMYGNYTNLSTSLSPGDENVEITISNGDPYNQDDIGIWADWNQDGDFDDTAEQLVCEVDLGWSGTGIGTFYFDVPENAMPGATVMRVRLKYTGSDCGGSCGSTTYGEVEDYTLMVEDATLTIDADCILEGFYNGFGMDTGINNLLPLDQPYNQSPWNYPGSESVVVMPANIVDWVLVELRDAFTPLLATSATSIGMQAALLRSDGKIVGMDGTSLLEFDVNYGNNLFLIIHYRNHLSVISSIGLSESAGIYEYDFSDGPDKAYGGVNAQNQLDANTWGVISGDANGNGTVDMDDIDPLWINSAGTHEYNKCDFNGDGEVNNIDKDDFWIWNQNKSTYVPN